ncbi:MAG: diacylglycerol kinase family lipid kinase, partial [Ignavibacteriales bacterium]|nr:diacylglycerol kinase family lipid kinase [Ignavibacteriales bacterium]
MNKEKFDELKTVEKYHFIVNRTANRGRAGKSLPALEEKLRAGGVPHQMHFTESPGDATRIAGRLPDGASVIVVGGDGTINEVVNGLYGRDCMLSIIPAGSGNDFVKMFDMDIPRDRSIGYATGSKIRQIDIGHIQIKRKNGVEVQRYFVNAVGIGLDALVSHINSQFNLLKGFPAYVVAALKAIVVYKPQNAVMRLQGQVWEGRPLLLAVGNGSTVGGGFKLTPNAQLDDGMLDICWAERMSLWRIARILP